MTEKRFHPFAVLHLLRKTILVYLLPLVQVLFARNWAALWAALVQDLVLFALLSAACWAVLHASGWQTDAHGNLLVRWRLGIRLDRTLRADMLAALTIDRPVVYRLAGASRLTLYPAGQKKPMTLIVSHADARELADRLLPLEQPVVHRPHGGEKMVFAVLGANGLSTLALLALALRQSRPYAPDITRRSKIYFLPAGLPLGLCLLLTAVSRTTLPTLTLPLLVPDLFFAALLAAAFVGYRREGAWMQDDHLTLRRQKGFHLHCVCALHPDLCLTVQQSPWAVAAHRANLTLIFPGRLKQKVRSVALTELAFLQQAE